MQQLLIQAFIQLYIQPLIQQFSENETTSILLNKIFDIFKDSKNKIRWLWMNEYIFNTNIFIRNNNGLLLFNQILIDIKNNEKIYSKKYLLNHYKNEINGIKKLSNNIKPYINNNNNNNININPIFFLFFCV